MEQFDQWRRNVVKSIHYSDNKAMSEAYEKVAQNEINNIEVKYESNSKRKRNI